MCCVDEGGRFVVVRVWNEKSNGFHATESFTSITVHMYKYPKIQGKWNNCEEKDRILRQTLQRGTVYLNL
jgi:hypothetical protein